MLVLGLDPGSQHTGWGLVDCVGARLQARGWGRFSPPPRLALAARLHHIADGLERILEEHRPELAAVERVFHGRNTRSLIVLAEARGALLVTLSRRGVPLLEFPPATIKSAVAGHGGAGKEQVAKMVRILLRIGDGSLAPDAADALAAAITGGQSARLGSQGAS